MNSHSAEDGYSRCRLKAGHNGVHICTNGPPVTGDGDASLDADVREILDRNDLPSPALLVESNDVIVRAVREAYAAGLARGRALGAREEKDHARAMEFLQEMSQPTTYAGGCAWCGGFDEHGDICELRDWLAEIEARHAGRTP